MLLRVGPRALRSRLATEISSFPAELWKAGTISEPIAAVEIIPHRRDGAPFRARQSDDGLDEDLAVASVFRLLYRVDKRFERDVDA